MLSYNTVPRQINNVGFVSYMTYLMISRHLSRSLYTQIPTGETLMMSLRLAICPSLFQNSRYMQRYEFQYSSLATLLRVIQYQVYPSSRSNKLPFYISLIPQTCSDGKLTRSLELYFDGPFYGNSLTHCLAKKILQTRQMSLLSLHQMDCYCYFLHILVTPSK